MAEGVITMKGNSVRYSSRREDAEGDAGDKETTDELEDGAPKVISVDEAVEQLGCGFFQVFITFFSGFMWVSHAIELMVLAVLSPVIKSQWNISSSEGALITSMVFVGNLLGNMFWGPFCDTYGRKKTFAASNIGLLVFGVLTAVPVSSKDFGYPWLAVMRMAVGFMHGGSIHVVTHIAEFVPKKARGTAIITLEIFWAAGSMLGALLALATLPHLDWHWYLGLSAAPIGLVLLILLWVPESARFYAVRNKYKKAEKVIKSIAWFNCKAVPQGRILAFEDKIITDAVHEQTEPNEPAYDSDDETKDQPKETQLLLADDVHVQSHQSVQETDDSEEDAETELKVYGTKRKQPPCMKIRTILKSGLDFYKPLFTHGVWRTTLPLAIIWFGCGWLYYGIILLTTSLLQHDAHCGFVADNSSNSSSLTSSDYLKIAWSAAAEIPGVILTLLIIDRLGRKKTMVIEFVFAAGSILLLLICTSPIVLTVFLFIARGVITGAYMAVIVYTPEVYPTSIRAVAMGIHSTASRIGAIASPFVAEVLIHKNDYLTISLYAASAIVLAIMAVLLPIETTGRPLKDREQ